MARSVQGLVEPDLVARFHGDFDARVANLVSTDDGLKIVLVGREVVTVTLEDVAVGGV